MIEIIHTFVQNVDKASSVFPFCHNTISYRMFTFEILNFQNYFIGTDTQILKTNCSQLADFNWHNTNKWLIFQKNWNLFSSLLLKLSTQFEIKPCLQDPSTAAISEWMLHLHTLFLICSTQQHRHQFHRPSLLTGRGAIVEHLTYHTLLIQMYWQHD